jgi:hypothetical protein
MSPIKTTHITPIPKKLWLPVPPPTVILRVQLATAAVLSAFFDHDLTILSQLWLVVFCVDSPICNQFAVPIGLRLTDMSVNYWTVDRGWQSGRDGATNEVWSVGD